MRTLKTSDAKEGMELAESVTNIKGMVLLKTGGIISNTHVKAFKAWGITEVYIKDTQTEDPPAVEEPRQPADTETESAIKAELDFLFQKTNRKDPIIKELYRLTLESKLEAREGSVNAGH